jgi:hypothetical protein
MENSKLLAAVERRGKWLMARPQYSLGFNGTNTALRICDRDDERRVLDQEPVDTEAIILCAAHGRLAEFIPRRFLADGLLISPLIIRFSALSKSLVSC